MDELSRPPITNFLGETQYYLVIMAFPYFCLKNMQLNMPIVKHKNYINIDLKNTKQYNSNKTNIWSVPSVALELAKSIVAGWFVTSHNTEGIATSLSDSDTFNKWTQKNIVALFCRGQGSALKTSLE